MRAVYGEKFAVCWRSGPTGGIEDDIPCGLRSSTVHQAFTQLLASVFWHFLCNSSCFLYSVDLTSSCCDPSLISVSSSRWISLLIRRSLRNIDTGLTLDMCSVEYTREYCRQCVSRSSNTEFEKLLGCDWARGLVAWSIDIIATRVSRTKIESITYDGPFGDLIFCTAFRSAPFSSSSTQNEPLEPFVSFEQVID